jgi:hypothetical protein
MSNLYISRSVKGCLTCKNRSAQLPKSPSPRSKWFTSSRVGSGKRNVMKPDLLAPGMCFFLRSGLKDNWVLHV